MGALGVLAEFGVSPSGVDVWTRLVAKPSTAADLVAGTGWDRGQVDEALRELLELGVVEYARDGSGRVDALSPVETHRLLMRESERRWGLRRQELEAASERFAALEDGFVATRRDDVDVESIERLRGSSAVNARLLQLRERADETVWSLTPDDGGPVALVDGLEALRHRGVDVRLIVDRMIGERRDFRAQFDADDPSSPEVRVVPYVPMRMVIVDGVALTPIDRENASAGAYVYSGALAAVASGLFVALWDSGLPPQPRSGEPLLSPRERQVCHLLVRGATDDQTARALGLSARTVRKTIGSAERKLGASSRSALAFQLGARGILGTDRQPTVDPS